MGPENSMMGLWSHKWIHRNANNLSSLNGSQGVYTEWKYSMNFMLMFSTKTLLF